MNMLRKKSKNQCRSESFFFFRKPLEFNLTKQIEDLYNENFKIPTKDIEDDRLKGL